DDLIVVASPQGTFVAPKSRAAEIKSLAPSRTTGTSSVTSTTTFNFRRVPRPIAKCSGSDRLLWHQGRQTLPLADTAGRPPTRARRRRLLTEKRRTANVPVRPPSKPISRSPCYIRPAADGVLDSLPPVFLSHAARGFATV